MKGLRVLRSARLTYMRASEPGSEAAYEVERI